MTGWIRRTIVAASALALVAFPATASADVLIDPSHLSGQPCIMLGVWYQSFSGGPHTISAAVYRGTTRISLRHLRATTTWRFYALACPRPGTYSVRLTLSGRQVRYTARVPLPN